LFSNSVIALIQSDDVKTFTADITNRDSVDKEFLVSLEQGNTIPLIAVFAPGRDEPFILQGAYTQQDIADLVEEARNVGRTASAGQ